MTFFPSIIQNIRPVSFIGGYPLYPNPDSTSQTTQLQSAIAAATSGTGELPPGTIHHPITCTGKLGYDEDGVFYCEHSKLPPNDVRTKACLIHSLALQIIEEAYTYRGMEALPYDRTVATENE